MFICPPAAARLMTNRLEHQVLWSVIFAVTAAVSGYVLAGYGPLWLGGQDAVSAAGMPWPRPGIAPPAPWPMRHWAQ